MKQRPEGGTRKQTVYSQNPEGGCGLLESPEDPRVFIGKGRIVHLA